MSYDIAIFEPNDTWLSHQTGFAVLTLSIFYYGHAVAETLVEELSSVPPLKSILLPLFAAGMVESIRWYVLKAFPQEDKPYNAWYKSIRKWWAKRHLLRS